MKRFTSNAIAAFGRVKTRQQFALVKDGGMWGVEEPTATTPFKRLVSAHAFRSATGRTVRVFDDKKKVLYEGFFDTDE